MKSDWLTQEQRDASILPQVVDNGEVTVCGSISGGADLVDEMPRELTLIRWTRDGREIEARYAQVKKSQMTD